MDDEPSGLVASLANFSDSMAFFFILFPWSPSNNSLTIFSTSSLLMSKSISVPMIHSLQVYLQLVSKSEVNGKQIEIEPKKIIKKKTLNKECQTEREFKEKQSNRSKA